MLPSLPRSQFQFWFQFRFRFRLRFRIRDSCFSIRLVVSVVGVVAVVRKAVTLLKSYYMSKMDCVGLALGRSGFRSFSCLLSPGENKLLSSDLSSLTIVYKSLSKKIELSTHTPKNRAIFVTIYSLHLHLHLHISSCNIYDKHIRKLLTKN